MKTMKLILPVTVLLLPSFLFTSCSDDDNITPDNKYTEALTEIYPNATRVEWEKKGNYTVADFRENGKDLDVWFDAATSWVMTETELLVTDIPEVIKGTLADTDYADWKIDDVDLLEYPADPKLYVIEVEQGAQEWDLYFSEEGELLNKKDVSNADDTHWPNAENNDGLTTRALFSYRNWLKDLYPNAKGVDWERKGTYMVAECKVNRKEIEVWFVRSTGEWVKTEHELRVSELPAAVTQAISAEYAGWKIDDAEMIEYPNQEKVYVVEVEKRKNPEYKLYYSEDGRLLDKKRS